MFFKKKITGHDLFNRFEEIHLPTISPGTRMRYEIDLKYRIRPYFGGYPLKKIDKLCIYSFRSEIMKNLSPKSVNNCTGLLALVFNKAVEWGMLEKSPMAMKNLKLPDARYSWWEKTEHITAFLAEAKKTPYYSAYLLALECGLRLGEIVGLSKQDVDLKRCQLNIHQQWLEAQGRLGPTKGRKQRFISFDPQSDLREALCQAISRSPHKEAIFVTRTGRRIRSTKLRVKLFPILIRKSGVPTIRFHDLRHTFASWYMLKNDNIWSLKQILGHTDIQTTQRYAHLSARQTVQSINWKES
jgi:integrase